jgi:hypothetical protein
MCDRVRHCFVAIPQEFEMLSYNFFRTLFGPRALCAMVLLIGVASMAETASKARAGEDRQWELLIAIPESDGERSISLDEAAHFHVILTNRSGAAQKIWKDSNSWGYYALRFEVTDAAGGDLVLRKKERSWRKNIPSFWVISDGESLVYDVSLASGEWDGIADQMRGQSIRIRAILEIPEEEKAQELGVWTGRVASAALQCTFR